MRTVKSFSPMTKLDYTLDDLNVRIKENLAKKCAIVLLVLDEAKFISC